VHASAFCRRFLHAALAAEPQALYRSAMCFHEALGTARNQQFAVTYMQSSAHLGCAAAAYEYANWDLAGKNGLAASAESAAYWMRIAAAEAHTDAQLWLAHWHMPADVKAAVQWFAQAAESGNAEAQFHLGKALLEGAVVEPDYERALQLLTSAGKNGYDDAEFYLGECHFFGRGAPVFCSSFLSFFSFGD
jgi:TPR repeat protein